MTAMQIPVVKEQSSPDWKLKAYVIAIGGGLLFGLIGGYLYTRAAQENSDPINGRPSVSTTQMIGLALAAFGLVRQITALGEAPKGKGKKK